MGLWSGPYLRGTSHVSGKGAFAKTETWKGGSMKSRVLSRGLILLTAMAFSFTAWAAPAKKTIHIQQPLQVGDTTLTPGDYTVIVDGSEATFERGNKVVVKVSCAVKDNGEKYSDGAVVYANKAITELRFAGQSQVITFNPTTTSTPSKSPSSSSGDR
jgi:hypothetical protein